MISYCVLDQDPKAITPGLGHCGLLIKRRLLLSESEFRRFVTPFVTSNLGQVVT